jgi:hypothetical protein
MEDSEERFRRAGRTPNRNSIGTVRIFRWCVIRVADTLTGEPRTRVRHRCERPRRCVGRQRPDSGRGRSGKAREKRRSSGAAHVVVMQTADVWNWDDRATAWRLGSPTDGSILVQREVRAPLVILPDPKRTSGSRKTPLIFVRRLEYRPGQSSRSRKSVVSTTDMSGVPRNLVPPREHHTSLVSRDPHGP